MPDLIEELNRLNIEYNDLSLYKMAFTHASYTNEHPECLSYDRLEFLGDSVLSFFTSELLFDKYKDYPSGKLSKMRIILVEGKTLTYLCEEVLKIDSLVLYSVGEKDNTRFHHHINEDVFESFVAAIYLDKGYEYTKEFLLKIYTPLLDTLEEQVLIADSKSRLQELIGNVKYVKVGEMNINTPNSTFIVEARYAAEVLGVGRGHNIKEAEINAAKDALDKKVGK